MSKGAPSMFDQPAKPRPVNWRVIAGLISVIGFIICLLFKERDPHSDNPSAIALLIGITCGLIVMAAHANAERARREYKEVGSDIGDACDMLFPVNLLWISLVVTILVPAIAIWIFPLKWWPHGAFYYVGGAVGAFIFTPIFRRSKQAKANKSRSTDDPANDP